MGMTLSTPHRPGASWTLLVSCVALFATSSGSAATPPIYKCLDKNLGLLYTDQPCKDGELMNIRAGDADPVAVARLERARDAIDQRAAQRIADQQRVDEQQDLAALYTRGNDRYLDDSPAAGTPYDYGAIGLLPGVGSHHPPRARPRKILAPWHFSPRQIHLASRN